MTITTKKMTTEELGAMGTTTDTAALERRPVLRRRLARLRASLRFRILAWYVGLLAVATVASVLVTRQILVNRLDERIDAELTQEASELRTLATGRDPETGEQFAGRARRVLEVFLERNVPSQNEVFLTFVGGVLFQRSRPVVPYRLDRDPELLERWRDVAQTDRGRVETPAGDVEYLAVPLRRAGETRAVFVIAKFRDRELGDLAAAAWAAGAVGLAVLLIGSLLAWRLAERVLVPIRAVTRTAHSISETDLGRRITASGEGEVGELAATFNRMLERLEAAFAVQRRFIDDAGHELRTPITIVRGHLELMGDDPDERRETIALVTDELERMSRIVNDLLDLAKAEEVDFLDLGTVDVEQLTVELHEKAKALAPREWTLAATGRGVIVADRQRLTQAVVQLAQNAVTHSPEGEPIELGSAVRHGEARFWVRDNGPGIQLAEQKWIFGRFARGGTGPRRHGAGLGLAIVQTIAQAHHGSVELVSSPGAGSTFTVVLPTDQPHDHLEEQ